MLAVLASVVAEGAVNAAYERAGRACNEERYDDAERELRRVIADDPKHARAHGMLAYVMTQLDRSEEAVALARRGFALAPKDKRVAEDLALALAAHAWTALEERRLDAAEALAEEALHYDEIAEAWSAMASSLSLRDRWSEARVAIEKALALAPDDGDIRRRAETIARGCELVDETERQLDAETKEKPNDPAPLFAKADFLFRLGRLDESMLLHAAGGAMTRPERSKKRRRVKKKRRTGRKSV
ncbi:MAG: tetratricopeptide repeat protein [Deltaproteobacteria bacterium]|nr:tetratricopeptide repeat protein [Deltaproteobacteria bacterium]